MNEFYHSRKPGSTPWGLEIAHSLDLADLAVLNTCFYRVGIRELEKRVRAYPIRYVLRIWESLCLLRERLDYRGEKQTEIAWVAVHPSQRRLGLGRCLVETGRMLAWTPVVITYLGDSPDPVAQRAFWDAVGFKPVCPELPPA